MKITNHHGLPDALLQAVSNDPYDNGGAWRSVTQLIAPPRQVVLKKRHDSEITVDVAERLFALYGQIVHQILERANSGDLVEERLFTECRGRRISGGFDVLQADKGKLIDWKFSTVYKAMGPSWEWEAQTNLLALLCRRQLGLEIKELEIVLLMRDHSKPKARREPNYPKLPVQRIPIRLWSQLEQDSFLEERVDLHLKAEETLPECTREEKWQKDDVWAICRKGYRKAVPGGLCTSKEAAEKAIITSGKNSRGYYVQQRTGESTRCLHYCDAANFCSQHLLEEQKRAAVGVDGETPEPLP